MYINNVRKNVNLSKELSRSGLITLPNTFVFLFLSFGIKFKFADLIPIHENKTELL